MSGLRLLYRKEAVKEGLDALERRYASAEHGIMLERVAGGVRFVTRGELMEPVAAVLGHRRTITLSPAALETLSLIAYKQPIGKADIEAIRGVQSDGVLRSLIELELVRVVGRDESLGRAFLYGTTRKFLEQFGLNGIKDLPRPEA
jgi:segregation and condensation protein B